MSFSVEAETQMVTVEQGGAFTWRDLFQGSLGNCNFTGNSGWFAQLDLRLLRSAVFSRLAFEEMLHAHFIVQQLNTFVGS